MYNLTNAPDGFDLEYENLINLLKLEQKWSEKKVSSHFYMVSFVEPVETNFILQLISTSSMSDTQTF